jgi:GNAT superfamily N-acetyltransferase
MSGKASSRHWRVRKAVTADRAFLEKLASRLTIGIAPWLDADRMRETMRGFLLGDLERTDADSVMLVAEAPDGASVGVVAVARGKHFTGVEHAYIGELAVIAQVEGQGVGAALLSAAEAWACERGLGTIALDTGAANSRAREFYAEHGYAEESVRLVKVLDMPHAER